MNDLQIFNSPQFGEIRTVEKNDKVYFCGSDVAKALGYARPNDAISAHCRATVKRSTPISGKMQDINFIPEGDVYRLITHSKLPAAEQFERWVFDDVLPTIRKHGMFAVDELLDNPDFAIKVFAELKEERDKRKALEIQAEHDKPKVLFADAVAASSSSILIGDLAKILKQNGMQTGQKRLFEQLRNEGYLMKEGSSRNLPTQRSMELGPFEVKESTVNNPDGSIRINKTTKVTGKGQTYFISKYLTQ